MKTRILFALLLIIAVTVLLRADWLTISIGRVDVQELITPDDNMMSWLSAAGSARVDAEERISRIVEAHCQASPAECAALGIRVRPVQ